jgi:DnaJ-domain-containing protein 1
MRTSHKPKPKSAFAKIDANRKRYNPDLEGYGNPVQWRKSLSERIGFEEAQGILRKTERDARELLGVRLTATWGEITKAFRRKALAYHPDRVRVTGLTIDEATEAFKEIRAAYTVLAHEHGK